MPVKTIEVAGHRPQVVRITGYAALVRVVRQELDELDFFIRRRTAETYWRVGKFIHEHLLKEKERADHGSNFFEKLAEDVGRDASTLSRCLQFNRAYPILALGQELTWGHYRILMTIRDEEERSRLEKKIIREDWDTHDLADYLRTKRALEAAQDEDKPVPQLKVTRGKLNVYKVVETAARKESGEMLIDHGFGSLDPFSGGDGKGFKDGELIEYVKGHLVRSDAAENDRYTYKAYVEHVVDGDTLAVLIEKGNGLPAQAGGLIRDRLRLRGIDCPELSTEEGKRAKRFVEKKLGACSFIVIRTYKERKDLHARYIADVFYLPDCPDAAEVAVEGVFLNQELLDERLAVAYP